MSRGASVGAQIKWRREQRGLSAAELARRANLSKAALSRIETGRGNPTIETLDALAFALHLPLTDLLADGGTESVVHRTGTVSQPGEVQRERLARVMPGQGVELWRLRMPPHTTLEGVPHAAGTVEYLLVAGGFLEAGPAGQVIVLAVGDLLSFPGNGPHGYRTHEDGADVTVLLASPAT